MNHRNSTGRSKLRIALYIVAGIFALLLFLPGIGFWTIVDAGHVGVVTSFGAVNRVVNPGLVFKLPLVESVYSMETRTQKEQVEALAASKDLQQVTSTIALNFHLRGEKAVDVYQNIGEDYLNRIVDPAMQEAFKSTTSQFTASDLIGKREQVKLKAYTELKDRLDKYNIVVDDFNIVNFSFSKEFNDAIEQKTIAEQNKEKAQIEAQTALIQAQNQAQAALILAQGQAQAQKKLKDAGGLSPAYLEFLAIEKWDGKLPDATNGIPFLQIPTNK
jgi:regulator of protease activity HflC (stomatin/prohibitin superfamily)